MSSYVVGWGTLALINAALANAGGRNPLTYFLASLFLGPLITLLLATTREDSGGHLHGVEIGRGRAPNDGPSNNALQLSDHVPPE